MSNDWLLLPTVFLLIVLLVGGIIEGRRNGNGRIKNRDDEMMTWHVLKRNAEKSRRDIRTPFI